METNALKTQAPAPPLEILAKGFINYIDRPEKTAKTYITNIRQFMAFLKYRGITAPTRQDFIAFRDYLTAEHEAIRLDPSKPEGWSYRTGPDGQPLKLTCEANTAAQYMRSAAQLFTWTEAAGLYPNIAKNVHPPKIYGKTHKKDALRPEDVAAIEAHIKARADLTPERRARLLAMYQLAVNAGLRTIELQRARLKDLDVRGGQAVLYITGKGHAEADQVLPLAPGVYDTLRAYLDLRTGPKDPTSPIFTATGNRSKGKAIAARTISSMFKDELRAAGYDSARITAHSFRHTAGTAYLAITGDLYATQHYMRHQNPATTEIYLHADQRTQQAAGAAALFDYYHGKGPEKGDTREK